jgi:hypothetical protein
MDQQIGRHYLLVAIDPLNVRLRPSDQSSSGATQAMSCTLFMMLFRRLL